MKKLIIPAFLLFAIAVVSAALFSCKSEKVEYEKGEEVLETGNNQKSFFMLKSLAKKGNVNAQHELGSMYMRGDGAPKNNVMAYMWVNVAGANGWVDTPEVLEIIAKRMTHEDISKAQQLANQCWESKYKNCSE